MVWILIWNIWKRLKVTVWGPLPRYANATLKHDKDSIYCALLNPQWKQSLTSNSVEVGDTWSLKCSIAGLDRQIRNFAPILIITEAKNANFFMCKRTEFVHEELRDFVKMTLARLSSHWLWLESSHWLESRFQWCAVGWTTLGRNLVNLSLTLIKPKRHIWPQKFGNFWKK